MPPKGRKAPRRTGSGAAKAVAVAAPEDAAEGGEEPPRLGFLPADPEDPRLTLAGLVVGGDGKVDIVAYEDLKVHYAGEPSPDQHPDPEHPGVRHGERVPKGLRVWDDIRAGATDKDGAGWAAVRSATQLEKKKEKWFNIRTCGSWRLAFLLARLQREYWDERAAWLKAPVPAAGEVVATEVAEAAAKAAATPPPKGKRAREPAADGEAGTPKTKRAAKPKAAPEASGEKKPVFGSDVLAGSARLQQLLAQRKQQEQK